MVGQNVLHPQYGTGYVSRSRNLGYELLVKFQSREIWVKYWEITLVEDASISAPLKTAVGSVVETPEEPSVNKVVETPVDRVVDRLPDTIQFRSRRLIEAFRMGITPIDEVNDFTFGRDTEIQTILTWLSESDSGSLLLEGTYGIGKTHLLENIYSKAIHNGFAVAKVTVDLAESPFYRPKLIYSKLVREFAYFDKATGSVAGFRQFLLNAFEKYDAKDNPYLHALRVRRESDQAWEWIEACSPRATRPFNDTYSLNNTGGRLVSCPPLFDHQNAANIYCYLLSSLGWIATHILGLNGLLLIFDEAEVFDMYTPARNLTSKNFLSALFRSANNDATLLDKPYTTGLYYSGSAFHTPFLFNENSGLKLLFTLTDIKGLLSEVPAARDAAVIYLESLSADSLLPIFGRLRVLYTHAYGHEIDALEADELFEYYIAATTDQPRLLLKKCIELLDLLRTNREAFFVYLGR